MASLSDQLPLYGGIDDDALVGDAGANVMHGDAGDDTLSGAGGADTLIGGLGDDLLFGGSGANVLYGGAGADILTYDSDEAAGALQRLFGGEGTNTLVLEFAQDDYLEPGVIDEVEAFANALADGENPGDGSEFVFSTFALRAANFSSILIFVDGAPLAPGEVPGVDAVDDAFATTESGSVSGSVVLNDNFPAGASVSLLAPPANGDLTLEDDGTFTFATNGAFETISAGDAGIVTFAYRLTEDGDTSDATVEITITGENDAPTAGVAVASTNENQSVSGNLITSSGADDVDANDVLSILSINGQPLGGAALTINLPSGAVITVTPTGAYTYAPSTAFDSLASGVADTEVIAFIISDGQGGQVASSLTLTINGENDAPTANADATITTEEDAVTFDVLGNDTDVDQGAVLTLVSVDSVTGGGSAGVTPAGQIQFQPGDDFQSLSAGANAFVQIAYTMQDGSGARSSSVATVTVTGANDAPTANAIADSTTEDASLTGNLLADANADDIDSADVLTISAIDGVAFAGGFSAPTSGGALLTVLANGDYTYAPNAGFNGLGVGETATDSFTYTVDDGRGGAVTRTFSIDITGANDGPVVQDIAITAVEDGSQGVDFLVDSIAFDPDDNGVLALTAVNGVALSPQASFFSGSNGGLLMQARRGGFVFSSQGDFEELSVGDTATTTFTFTIEDDQGAAVTRALSVEVAGANDDPTADPVEFRTDEDTAATGNFLDDSNAFDIDQNDTLTITEVQADGLADGALNGAQRTITLPNGATLTVAPNGDYSYLPGPTFQTLAPGQTGSANFSFRVADGQGGEVTVTVDVFVDGLNDDPMADAITRGALEDDTVFGGLLTDSAAADVDAGDVLRISQVNGQVVGTSGDSFAGADGGSIFVSDLGGYTFNPNGDFEFLSVGDTATSAFSFRIADSFGGFVDQTITFEIAGANDAPQVNGVNASTNEDTAVSGNFLDDGSATDVDQNDTLSVTRIFADGVIDGALNGALRVFTLASGAQLTVSPDGSYTYDPLQAFQSLPESGGSSDFLSFEISDGNGGTSTESLTISIAGVNDAPVAAGDTATTDQNTATQIVVLDNDSDVDSTFLLTSATQPDSGGLVDTSNGVRFDPNGDFDFLGQGQQTTTTFTYTITDDRGASDTGSVVVTVTGLNDGPVTTPLSETTDEDRAAFTFDLLTDQTDVDQNDFLSVENFTEIDTTFGAFSVAGGVFTFDARQFDGLVEGETQVINYTYDVVDGLGARASTTFELIVEGRDEVLEANDDNFTTDEDTILTDDVSLNDTIRTGDIILDQGVDAGQLTLNADGTFTFDPNGEFDSLADGDTDSVMFTYVIEDGVDTATATATIEITGANDNVIIDAAASDLAASFTQTGGAAGDPVISATALDGTNGFALVGGANNLYAGSAVAGGGDFDGDGFDDVVVGAFGYSSIAGVNTGSAFVLFGDGTVAPASREIPGITPAEDGISLVGQDNERLGRDAAFVGDVNGDGFDDFLIGNSASNANGPYTGTARLVFGRDFTGVTGYEDLDATNSTSFIDSSTANGGTRNLGANVSSAGDVNNDGINDFIIGAPFSTVFRGDEDFGKAFVVFGRSAADAPFGEVFDLATLDGTNGFRIDTGTNLQGSLLGASVGAAGDVNGDGIDDVIVGAPGITTEVFTPPDTLQTFPTGASFVIFGSDSAIAASVDVSNLGAASGFTITEPYGDSRIGLDVAGIGDFNGDGFDDFIVGSEYYGAAGNEGAAYIIYGSDQPFGDLVNVRTLAATDGFKIVGGEYYDGVGIALSAAGDFNGDGFDDVIIGAQSNFEGLYVGEAYVLFGTDQTFTSPFNLAGFDETDGVKLTGFDAGDLFGSKVSGAGDLNQDGFDDVIVGALAADLNSPGAAFVFYGAASGGGSGGSVGGAGSVFFTDVDLTDAHTVSDDAIAGDVTFTFDLVTDSTGGLTGEAQWTAVINDEVFATLAEGETEVTSVNVTVDDGLGGAATETIEVSFVGVNDAPTVAAAARTIDEDTVLDDGDLIVEGAVLDIDNGDVVRISSISFNSDSGVQTVALSATPTAITIGDASLTIDETGFYSLNTQGTFDSLNTGETGAIVFNFVAEDQFGATSTESATITITGVNDAPTAIDDTATTDQDTAIQVSVFANDDDPEGGLRLISIDAASATGSVAIESAQAGTIVFNPNGNFDTLGEGESATDTFTYSLEDTGGLQSTATVTVTVTGINDAPVASDVTVSTSEDDTVAGNFLLDGGGLDIDLMDILTVQSIDGVAVTGANQTINLASDSRLLISPNGEFTYNPFFGTLQTLAEGVMADDVISVVISDGDLTATSDLIVSVTGVNDAPTTSALSRTTNEDEPAFVIDLLANAVDVDQGDVLSVSNFVENQSGFGSFTLAGTDLTYNATIFDNLNAGETQVVNFNYDIVDSQGARVATTLELTIEGRDEDLLAVDDAFTTDEDTTISDDVSTNDVDQGAVFSLVTTPNGDITFNADGTFDYDPASFYNSLAEGAQDTDTFTYQIDNGTDTVTATVTLTIDGVNDAPGFIVPGVTNIRLVTEDVTDTASGNNSSEQPALAGDGDTVTFDSRASNLIDGDTNARGDVYFEDPAETVDRANLQNGTNNQSITSGSATSEVNKDGSVIVFQSRDQALVPTTPDGTPIPNNNNIDIFVRDLNTGETQLLIPFGTDGARLNGNSLNASVSANGRFVTFESTATNLVTTGDINGGNVDIFRHDRETGETILISQLPATVETNSSFRPSISADGNTIAFLTANSHDAVDDNGLVDVYAYNVADETLTLVSQSSGGVVADQSAVSAAAGDTVSTPSVSANGRYISWVSRATNLVDDDTNNVDDIFVHDLFFGTTERASVTFDGIEGDRASFDTKISDNGRYVTFQSQANTLDDLFTDTNGASDVYVKDRLTDDLIRVSITPDFSSEPGGGSADISADGSKIAFVSNTVTGNFDDRVVTGSVNDIYIATIDTTGFDFTQNTAAAIVDLRIEWSDPDGGPLDFSNIDVTSDNTDRIFSVTEDFDDQGRGIGVILDASEFADLGVNDYELLTVTYDLTDGFATTSGATGIVIAGENDAPTADAQTFDVNQGGSVTGSFSAMDIDGDDLTFDFLATALQGDLLLAADGSFTYSAAADQAGDEIISINVEDGNGGFTSFDATFNVNLAPIFTPTNEIEVALTAQVNPDPMNSIDAAAFFNDPEGGGLTFSAVTAGFTNLRNGFSIDAATGEITGTPTLPGLDRVEVTATDAVGLSTTGGFWVARVGEVIFGDNDDNSIADGPNSSLINGLGGNDSITGDNNADIYQYRRGEGFDIINDTQAGGINRLVMTGFNSDEVQFSRVTANQYDDNGSDLLITPIGQPVDFTEGVLVRGALVPTNGASRLAFFHFDDGVIIDETDAAAQILAGETTAGNDDIRGFRTPDTLEGGLGDDVLSGGESSDTYIYNAGDGDDTIRDNGRFNLDVLEIGYNFADATYSRIPGTSIVVADFGGGDRLTLVDTLHDSRDGEIEFLRFLDGEFTMADIRADLISQQVTSGDDVVRGFGIGILDTLEGGAGNDTLLGFDGGDTYQYRAGGGDDVVMETGFQDFDSLEVFDFTIDYDLVDGAVNPGSQVTFERTQAEGEPIFQTSGDVVINLDNGAGLTGSITVVEGIANNNNTPLSAFVFDASGVSLTAAQIRSDLMRQQETSSDDVIRGFQAADTLNGGQGNDLLLGRDGTDTYQFATGDGDDTVREIGFQEADRVAFTDRALADFDIFLDPNDIDNVIFTAGTDRIEVVRGLVGGNNNNISFFDFTDQTLSEAQMRQVVIDRSLAEGRDLIGGVGNEIMPSSVGSDRFVQGRSGSDIYLYVAGDGNDTIFEQNAFGTDVLDLTAFSSQDFALAGPNSIRFDPAFTDRVQLFIDDSNTLDIIGFSQFEDVQFSDQSFDNNGNANDGPSFADYITSLVDEAIAADPNEDVITKVILQDPGGNNTLTSTALNENIRLDNSGDDQVIFNVSQIGDDSIFKETGTVAGYDITIDFSGIVADNVLQQDVLLSIDRADQHDLIIDIIYEDDASPLAGQGIGRVEERIVINNALETFGGVDTITIIDNAGRTVDLDGAVIDPAGLAPSFANTNEIRQLFLDRAVTAGDDVIPNYFASGLTLRGGGGDDTLSSARGGQTFEFSPGDGRVTVAEVGQSGGGTDIVSVNGFALEDAVISRSFTSTATLNFDFGNGDELVIRNFYPGGFVIEQFIFQADATTPQIVTGNEIATEYLSQLATSGDDIIVGGDGRNETLDGGVGNDTLNGQDGSDTYIVRRGEGDKLIRETGTADTDVLQLNVASTSVTFEQNPIDTNNFIIVMDDGTRVEIFNFLEGNDGKIEQFVFTDTTLDTTQARLQAFDDIATNGNDTIIGGDAPDTLRGGAGDDVLRGGTDIDVFAYAIGDGNDTLFTEETANEFEFIQITGVAVEDVIFERIQGTRDLRAGQPSLDEDLLISFANDAGSIRVENGLRQGSALDRIEIVDSGVTLTDSDVFNRVLVNDIANGRTILEGPSTGSVIFPSGAEFIFAQQQGDIFQFTAGQGTLTILDDAPTSETQRLEVLGYNSTDATFSRLAGGSEDFIIRLPSGDQIIVLGDLSGGLPVNGVNEIFFTGDNIVFNDADITTLIDGGSASGSSGGGGGGSGRVVSPDDGDVDAAPLADIPVSDDDTFVLSSSDDVMRLGAGDDHVRGKGGDDALWGQAGDDTLMGNGGADTLRGGRGEDDLRGGAGRDKLIGGGQDDMLRGNGGRDMLKGGRGEDELMGGRGNDVLKGGGGDDRIEGGHGNDRLTGQGGEDSFVFARGFGADVITDFSDGVDLLDFAAHNGVSALGDLTITQDGANSLITDGVGGQITLLRVDANDLQEDDFLF